ncbi:hypothetical protein CFN78_15505 [Amycolatopsis antarctica]|uniref:Uncharacterized protein n=1 Tax=Amycolatopsis antarctica TaxID=1854586 RepID=A0A263D1S1_9PSEU|nr:hypothetical protein [Amycolatopsis antarctica]OZM72390.1 hypothetical protein CFN78_15505 [Amycolatopsis antarctica]
MITDLAGRATVAALAEGMALLGDAGGPEVAAALADRGRGPLPEEVTPAHDRDEARREVPTREAAEIPRPVRRPRRRPVADEEENYTPRTWAVPN